MVLRARREPGRSSSALRLLASALVVLYATGVTSWALARHLWGDGFWLLALVNALGLWLFAPLPLAALLALVARRPAAWVALLLVVALFLGLFGAELTPPRRVAGAEADDARLTVMTYNVFFATTDVAPIAATIHTAAPDVIAFEELMEWQEQALVDELGDVYPYRTSARTACYAGVVVWSRFPLEEEATAEDVLCRVRQVLIDTDAGRVRVVAVHGWPYTGLNRASVEQSFRWRHEQMVEVLAAVDGQPEPLIVLGDLNSTPMHEMYGMLVEAGLTDAFREGGWGFGNTYPASGGTALGLPYPGRLVRIDHIFHSDAWRAERAYVAPWDGQSDHLPVVARLVLTGE